MIDVIQHLIDETNELIAVNKDKQNDRKIKDSLIFIMKLHQMLLEY